eukprot:12142636-Karenia_brevis.AAC.1
MPEASVGANGTNETMPQSFGLPKGTNECMQQSSSRTNWTIQMGPMESCRLKHVLEQIFR